MATTIPGARTSPVCATFSITTPSIGDMMVSSFIVADTSLLFASSEAVWFRAASMVAFNASSFFNWFWAILRSVPETLILSLLWLSPWRNDSSSLMSLSSLSLESSNACFAMRSFSESLFARAKSFLSCVITRFRLSIERSSCSFWAIAISTPVLAFSIARGIDTLAIS